MKCIPSVKCIMFLNILNFNLVSLQTRRLILLHFNHTLAVFSCNYIVYKISEQLMPASVKSPSRFLGMTIFSKLNSPYSFFLVLSLHSTGKL